jgi:hypothetical protein
VAPNPCNQSAVLLAAVGDEPLTVQEGEGVLGESARIASTIGQRKGFIGRQYFLIVVRRRNVLIERPSVLFRSYINK